MYVPSLPPSLPPSFWVSKLSPFTHTPLPPSLPPSLRAFTYGHTPCLNILSAHADNLLHSVQQQQQQQQQEEQQEQVKQQQEEEGGKEGGREGGVVVDPYICARLGDLSLLRKSLDTFRDKGKEGGREGGTGPPPLDPSLGTSLLHIAARHSITPRREASPSLQPSLPPSSPTQAQGMVKFLLNNKGAKVDERDKFGKGGREGGREGGGER